MNNYFRRKLRGIRATHTSVPTDEAEITNSDVLSFNCQSNKNLIDLQIYGNTTTSSDNPTPETPSVIESVGDKTGNLLKANRTISNDSWVSAATRPVLHTDECYIGFQTINLCNSANLLKYSIGEGTVSLLTAGTGYYSIAYPMFLTAGQAYTIRTWCVNRINKVSQIAFNFYDSSFNQVSSQVLVACNANMSKELLKSFTVPNNTVLTVLMFINGGVTELTENDPMVTFSNIMLVEGTYTSSTMPAYEPYGYKIPISLAGKNLFDISAYTFTEYKYIKYTDGSYNTASRALYATSDYIPINPNTTYTLSGVDTSGVQTAGYAIYDSSKAYITGGGANSSAAQTFTTGATAAYLRFTSWSLSAIQLEYGSTATTYEAFKGNTAHTVYLDEPLRKNGDNVDYISLKDGKVYRNNAEYNYKGNENIFIFDNNKGFRYTVGNQKEGKALDGFCNRYKNYRAVGDATASQRVIFGASDNDTQMYIRKFNTDGSDTTVADMQTALTGWYNGGNPLSVVYPTETQTAQTISFPSIATVNGTNIIKIGTAVMPSKIKAVFYK